MFLYISYYVIFYKNSFVSHHCKLESLEIWTEEYTVKEDVGTSQSSVEKTLTHTDLEDCNCIG